MTRVYFCLVRGRAVAAELADAATIRSTGGTHRDRYVGNAWADARLRGFGNVRGGDGTGDNQRKSECAEDIFHVRNLSGYVLCCRFEIRTG